MAIKYDWDGISIHTTKEDWEQELIDQDMLAQLHAEHMDATHICVEDECPYFDKDGGE